MTLAHRLRSMTIPQWRGLYLLLALLIVCKIMYNQHGWVNNDSLLYFEQARLLSEGAYAKAFSLFSWLLYPGLLALIHTVTTLDIHTSAQLLNAVCFVLFVAAYQQLLLEAGAKLRTLHWAHVLLFSTHYIVADVLGMLLRDEGFWAAFSWGLVFWLRALKSQQWRDGLLFQVSMIVATLFRIESAAYLIGIPFVTLCYTHLSWQQRMRLWIRGNLLSIMAVAMIVSGLLSGMLHAHQLGRLQEIVTQITQLFGARITFINQKAALLGQTILGEDLDDYATFTLWVSLLFIALVKTLKVAGYPVLWILLWPKSIDWWRKQAPAFKFLATMVILLSFAVSVVIILNVFVLSSRYVIATGIVMLVLAALAVSEWSLRWTKPFKSLVILFFVALTFYSLWDKASIDLDRQAVDFIEQINTEHKPVFYDTENARYYAHQPYIDRVLGYVLFPQLVALDKIDTYDYYMITVSKHSYDLAYEQQANEVLQQHHYRLLKTYYGWHQKTKVMIYGKPALKNIPSQNELR